MIDNITRNAFTDDQINMVLTATKKYVWLLLHIISIARV